MTRPLVRTLELLRRGVRRALPFRAYVGLARLVDACYAIRFMGLAKFFELRRIQTQAKPATDLISLRLAGIEHPVLVRAGTTDAGEIIHSCARRAYGQFIPPGEVKFIIDAGANIGDTTIWYLNRFPEATVIAVEPDEHNFSVLKQNCQPYGSRAIPIRAAVWPTEGEDLQIVTSSMASGISVAPKAANGVSGCPSVSMKGLLALTSNRPVDIFKCDIEGAELKLFSDGADEWLPSVRSIAIEIHSPACREAVFSATAPFGFKPIRYRDIYVLQQ